MNKPPKRPILVLAGPTCVGKTSLSIELAKRIPIEIVCADARQVYRYLDIGTAKPTAEQQLACKHHCIDIRHPSQPYSAAEYSDDARTATASLPNTSLPVIVGGSGLYISAFIDGLSTNAIAPNEETRRQLEEELKREGKREMHAKLFQADPVAAEKYSDMNPRRVLRALEYIRITGKKFSDTWNEERNAADVEPLFICVSKPTDVLNKLINERCVQMWNDGIVQETQVVLDMGVSATAQSLQTVGYSQVIQYFDGVLTEQQAIEKMQSATRQYAKRQRTWFKRDKRYLWKESPTVDDVLDLLSANCSFKRFVI